MSVEPSSKGETLMSAGVGGVGAAGGAAAVSAGPAGASPGGSSPVGHYGTKSDDKGAGTAPAALVSGGGDTVSISGE